MEVVISCCGKLHAFHLAEQLDNSGNLHKLFTTYYSKRNALIPCLRNDKEKISISRVSTNIIPDLISKGAKNIPLIGKHLDFSYLALEMFDDWTRENFVQCDIWVAWSGVGLHTFRKIKELGIIRILERGSSHIQFQNEILQEEYEKFNFKNNPVDKKIIKKELLEYEESDFISVPSTFAKKTFINKGVNPDKIIQIPYGVDMNTFCPVNKRDDVFRLIFVGSLTLRKGIQYLLEAYSQLKLKNSELLLIGAISPEIKQIIEKYEDSCKYIGVISHQELYKYLSQGSIFVLPSLEEGLAMVIPQAMACGLPVICTTNTGGSDILEEGKEGFIIPIRDIEALKEKILYFYKNTEVRNQMSIAALQKVHNFTWDIYGKKIIECYAKLLAKKK